MNVPAGTHGVSSSIADASPRKAAEDASGGCGRRIGKEFNKLSSIADASPRKAAEDASGGCGRRIGKEYNKLWITVNKITIRLYNVMAQCRPRGFLTAERSNKNSPWTPTERLNT